MCQIIGISNIVGLTKNEINKVCLAANKLMNSQPDGFGFAYSTKSRQGKHHTYYCEKFVNPKHFRGIGSVGNSKAIMKAYSEAIEMPMMSSGHSDAPTGPIIMHGRISTNGVNIKNTHPFRKKGGALIHNGVVSLEDWAFDSEDKILKKIDKRYSTCDSEWLLNTYIHGRGHHDWAQYLSGYAATMAITPENNFIVAKDSRASLFMAGIPELNNSVVFATKPEFCTAIAKVLNKASTPPYSVKGGRAVIIKPSGRVLIEKFQEMSSSSSISQHDINKSMGFHGNNSNTYATYNSNTNRKNRIQNKNSNKWDTDQNTWIKENDKWVKVKNPSKTTVNPPYHSI